MKRLMVATICGLALTAAPFVDQARAEVPSATEKTFQEDVLKAKEPVFVDFYTTWCGPCKKMAPVIEELSKEFSGKVKFLKVDVDDNGKLAEELKIESIPTFITYKKGKAVHRFSGLSEKAEISKKIETLLND